MEFGWCSAVILTEMASQLERATVMIVMRAFRRGCASSVMSKTTTVMASMVSRMLMRMASRPAQGTVMTTLRPPFPVLLSPVAMASIGTVMA